MYSSSNTVRVRVSINNDDNDENDNDYYDNDGTDSSNTSWNCN